MRDVVEEDVNSIETTGARAALRFDVNENFDATVGVIYQDMTANGHSDVTGASGDLRQVRFADEGLDDEWYQAALTLNARLPFADLVVAASYFDRKFALRGGRHRLRVQFQTEYAMLRTARSIYDFGGDPRGFATNHENTRITTFEARLQSNNDAESRWSWLAGVFYSKEAGHTEFDSFVHDYPDTPAFAYFSNLEYNLQRQPLAPTEPGSWGVTRPSSSSARYSARSASTSPRTSRSPPAGAGSSTTGLQPAPGSAGRLHGGFRRHAMRTTDRPRTAPSGS